MQDELDALVDTHFDEIIDTRRQLHARPELSFAEHETTGLIRDRLQALGLTPLRCPTETGAVFELSGGRPGRTVLVRADIDALPVHEEADVPFRSRIDGVMHACGHDGHTAMLLGLAAVLSARAEILPGRYVLLFQPAEELASGARAMIDGGVLEGLAVERVLSCHLVSMVPTGSVSVSWGVMLSDGQGVRIVLRGPGGHGAFAGTGNVVLAVSELARSLSTAVAGLVYKGTSCVCSAGVIRAGSALNVVPSTAVLEASLRTFTAAQKQEAIGRIRMLCAQVAAAAGVDVDMQLTIHAPAVVNNPDLTEIVACAARRWVGEDNVSRGPPWPPSDDISEFLNRIPGCYFFVGAAPQDGVARMHHSPTFVLAEQALRVGTTVLCQAAVDLASGIAQIA